MNQEILLNNHLTFLATHRGAVRREGETYFIESDRPEFSYAILGRDIHAQKLPNVVKTVQHLPWSGISIGELKTAGFVPTIGLSYMVLAADASGWKSKPDLTIVHSHETEHFETFSEVQSRGFNETQEDFENWYPWLRDANFRNQHNKDQFFYVGRLGREAVGTALTVVDGNTAGIYAVATLPAHRKKGISTAIMKQAVSDAIARGCTTITLQVKQDSYVEAFYSHLGFKRIFVSGMYRRNS